MCSQPHQAEMLCAVVPTVHVQCVESDGDGIGSTSRVEFCTWSGRAAVGLVAAYPVESGVSVKYQRWSN